MNDEVLIKVENVSKKFCKDLRTSLKYGVEDLASEIFGRQHSDELRENEFWAVKDVSFEVRRGECLGLIGRNGAGKTTLLRMLNGLIKPDKGRIEMRGRIGALIALGAGFNPILTGRENIYVNAAILGLSKKEINQKVDKIIDFAEIEDFIDSPVQTYSSGMMVRLGFSIAINMNPDILLLDEVLAVGDAGFRVKCYNEIYKILNKAAIIFVSHSMPQIGKICTEGALMKKGKIINTSKRINIVIADYLNQFESEKLTIEGSGRAHLESLEITQRDNVFLFNKFQSINNNYLEIIEPNESILIKINYKLDSEVKDHFVLIAFTDSDQKLVLQIQTSKYPINNHIHNCILVQVDDLNLNTGSYALSIHVLEQNESDWGEVLLGIRGALKIKIEQNKFFGSAPYIIKAKWKDCHD